MNKYSFENYIIQCCKAPEWELRKFLKKVLMRAGFNIQEDNYQCGRGEKYSSVHNMLAIRGNPKVCLVAHTDVCRDHINDEILAEPVIKEIETLDGIKRIIQDKNCDVQVGGDDRLGVAINTWIALNTGFDCGLLFTTDEEVGLVSAEQVRFSDLLNFDLLVQTDRGNHSNQLVSFISGFRICSPKIVETLLSISNEIELPRLEVNGFLTDVLAIKMNKMCKDAINLTCGYHKSYGANSNEFIDIQEAKDTMKYVASIIKFYGLKDIFESKNNEKQTDIYGDEAII
jgi:hypothetical protein